MFGEDLNPEEIAAWTPSVKGRLRHHLVPRFHLRRFADEEERLVLHGRADGRSFLSSVSNAAVRSGYYDVPIDGRWVGDVEKGIAELESLAAPEIARLLCSDEIDDQQRYRISVFMAIQLVRGADFADVATASRKARERLHRETTTSSYRRHLQEKLGVPIGEVFEGDERDMSSLPPQEFFRVAALSIAPDYFGGDLFNRGWHVLRFPEPLLLTADRPIVLWGRHGRAPIGLKSADVILFPISMDAVLAMYHRGAKPIFRGIASHAEAINAIVAASAYEWIFHHPDLDPLGAVDLPPPQPRSA